MSRARSCFLLAAALLTACALSCSDKGSSSGTPSAPDGYTMMCKHCSQTFNVPRDDLHTYPADPNGEGLKCPKCGKFGGKLATKCPKCNNWYIAVSRGMPCPKCK
jgi:hypothetical protein